MGLFGFGDDDNEDVPVFSKPVDPGWIHNPEGGFFPLLTLDPEEVGLTGKGGVYLIWHGGMRPEWVFAGHATDLAAALHAAGNNKDISQYERNGGLFVAWSPVMPKYRAGVVRYLEMNFKPLVPNPGDYSDRNTPVPVTPPTRRPTKP